MWSAKCYKHFYRQCDTPTKLNLCSMCIGKTSWASYVFLGQVIQRLDYGRTNPDFLGDWIPSSCSWYYNKIFM